MSYTYVTCQVSTTDPRKIVATLHDHHNLPADVNPEVVATAKSGPLAHPRIWAALRVPTRHAQALTDAATYDLSEAIIPWRDLLDVDGEVSTHTTAAAARDRLDGLSLAEFLAG